MSGVMRGLEVLATAGGAASSPSIVLFNG